MLLRKISLCALIACTVNVSLAHKDDFDKIDSANKKKSERRQVQITESALRSMAVAFVGGLVATAAYGNTKNAHLVGIGLTGSGNILFGELAFKDRNYWAQLAGMTFGYIVGAIAGDFVNKSNNSGPK